MKQNILALYLIKLSKWFSLVMPIIVLFYEDHGLGLQDVFILKSVYSVAAVALEIPSGYLADVWGRKKCLILGCIVELRRIRSVYQGLPGSQQDLGE